MIKVEIEYEDKELVGLKVKGHADSGEYGHDLVCGAVTAMLIGAANALDDGAANFEITIVEGRAEFIPTQRISEHDATVLETLIIQLKTLEVSPASRGTITIKERK